MRKAKGFTLMEMLIVIAIIAILIAIAIPLFSSQLDEAKHKTDLANERSAYAAALAEWMTTADIGKDVTYYYNGGAISRSSSGISGYGQSADDASTFTTGVDFMASGVPNDGTPQYLTVSVASNGAVSMRWGSGGSFAKWAGLGSLTGVNSNIWWKSTSERTAAFTALLESDNATRKAADIDTLNALASYFDGMSSDEALKILGQKRYDNAVKGQAQTLFEYNIDGGGSIRINNLDTDYQPYFAALGYDGKIWSGGTVNEGLKGNNAYNYVDKYLFTSNEMVNRGATDAASHKESPNNVQISFKVDENGKLTDTKVVVSQLRNEGYTSE